MPEKLQKVLEGAFGWAFELVFQKGTAVIENMKLRWGMDFTMRERKEV